MRSQEIPLLFKPLKGLPEGGLKTILGVLDPKTIEEATAMVMKYEGASGRPNYRKPEVNSVESDSPKDELDRLVMEVDQKTNEKEVSERNNGSYSPGQKGKNSDGGEKAWKSMGGSEGPRAKIDSLVDMVTQLVKERETSKGVGKLLVLVKPKTPLRDPMECAGSAWSRAFAKECKKKGDKLVALVQQLVEETGTLGMVAPSPEEDENEEEEQENC